MILIRKAQNGLSFSEAFKQARKQGKQTFLWNGKSYTTLMANEAYRPLSVTIQGLLIDYDELNRHGAFKTKSLKDSYEINKAPIVEMLSTDALKLYITGNYLKPSKLLFQNSDGKVAYINASDMPYMSKYNMRTKGLNLSDEDQDSYEEALIKSGYTTVMPLINVDANYRKASKNGKTLPGFVPINNSYYYNGNLVDMSNHPLNGRLFENTNTGEYVITNNQGDIIYRSDDPEVIFDPNTAKIYNGYYSRKDVLDNALKILAYDLSAEREIDSHIKNGWNPTTGMYLTLNLGDDIRRGRNTFYRGVNALVNSGNHAISGLARAAVNDDYSLNDYTEGFFNSPSKSTTGLGDILQNSSPLKRYVLNYINPTSLFTGIASTYANSEIPSQPFSYRDTKKSTIYVPNQGKVTGSNFTNNNKSWLGMGTASRTNGVKMNGRGWTNGGYNTQYGSSLIPISQRGKTSVNFSLGGLKYNPLQIDGNPILWQPLMFDLPNTIEKLYNPYFEGEEEVQPLPAHSWQYITTGELPKSNYTIIPNELNTNNGNYRWFNLNGNLISTVSGGTYDNKARKRSTTHSKPSK